MEIEDSVSKFLSAAADEYGEMSKDRFVDDFHCYLSEGEIQSPIEKLFYIALCMQCFSERENFNPEPEKDNNGGLSVGIGVNIQPQVKIGRYKVDFLLNRKGFKSEKSLIVELDGHQFHDKNKEQRAYEKARDRFFVKTGYKVIHFTGSEVVKDPYRCAFEALEIIGGVSYREEYNEEDPLGVNQ